MDVSYGQGGYGAGYYTGVVAVPLFPPPPTVIAAPMQILGIGPWNPTRVWRGAANLGVRPMYRPARPIMALPPATGLSYTLRLNEGGEGRADLAFTPDAAIIIEEMSTDLWWRRRDPHTGTIEMIGRFNTSHVDMSKGDTGITASVQFEDYRTVLSERLVLQYLDPVNSESMWPSGTSVTQILKWATPMNTGIDITALAAPALLGVTNEAFSLPPGSTIADVYDNVNAISAAPWEWWIETPTDINAYPKLQFVVGKRGAARGVVLYDHGGASPIATWNMRAAADAYANSLYYSGTVGGVVDIIEEQIIEFGQRDMQDGSSSLGGELLLLKRAAKKRLAELADRRPTFSIGLRQGYWRGRAHIDVGDTVRISIRLGRELITETYRVSELSVAIDETGAESVSLTLGTPLPSANPRSRRSPYVRLLRKLKNYEAPGPLRS